MKTLSQHRQCHNADNLDNPDNADNTEWTDNTDSAYNTNTADRIVSQFLQSIFSSFLHIVTKEMQNSRLPKKFKQILGPFEKS